MILNLLLYLAISYADDTQWDWVSREEHELPSLPRADSQMACFFKDDVIHILGGQNYPSQWIEYHVTNNTMIDRGNETLPVEVGGVYGSSQYYTQINETIYWIYSFEYIYRVQIDRIGNEAATKRTGGALPDRYTEYSCLASTSTKLYVIGGMDGFFRGSTYVRILDLDTREWADNVPMMNAGRKAFGCIVDPTRNELYAISGSDEEWKTWHKTNEKLNLNGNLSNNAWTYIGDVLYEVEAARVSYNEYDDTILIIGGYGAGHINRNEIQIIDCKTGLVTIGGYLEFGVSAHTSILVESTLYIFGGDYLNIDGEITGAGIETNLSQLVDGGIMTTNEPDSTMNIIDDLDMTTTTVIEVSVNYKGTEIGDENGEDGEVMGVIWIWFLIPGALLIICIGYFVIKRGRKQHSDKLIKRTSAMLGPFDQATTKSAACSTAGDKSKSPNQEKPLPSSKTVEMTGDDDQTQIVYNDDNVEVKQEGFQTIYDDQL